MGITRWATTVAVAGTVIGASALVGAGHAAADTTLGGYCYGNAAHNSFYRYSVFANARPIAQTNPDFAGYEVKIGYNLNTRNSNGTYTRSPNDEWTTARFAALYDDTLCAYINPDYTYVDGKFTAQ